MRLFERQSWEPVFVSRTITVTQPATALREGATSGREK